MRVAIATCARLPEPDPDADVLMRALESVGLTPSHLAWDDPTASPDADLVVLRSTWNYYRRPNDFLAWIDAMAARTRVLNPPDVVRWNAHKSYLRDLTARGIPTVPTHFVPRGTHASLASILDEHDWERAVVKPAVSAASFRTIRLHRREVENAQLHLDGILADSDAMIQPYVHAVESHGERSVVWIDGEVMHSVRKSPRFGSDAESVSHALEVETEQRDLALSAIAPWADRLLYARVDMVRDASGKPMIMELELIEPSLFLHQHPPALERFVAAIARAASR